MAKSDAGSSRIVAEVGDAVSALQRVQRESATLWLAFDPRCRVQLNVGAGPVIAGPMGPPDDLRFDVHGDTLNRLFKMQSDEIVISPELGALLS